jgi:hypothetical protein
LSNSTWIHGMAANFVDESILALVHDVCTACDTLVLGCHMPA